MEMMHRVAGLTEEVEEMRELEAEEGEEERAFLMSQLPLEAYTESFTRKFQLKRS